MLSLAISLLIAADPAGTLRFEPDESQIAGGVVAVLSPELRQQVPKGNLKQADGEMYLTVSVVGDDGSVGDPIIGSYVRAGDEIRFTPRFALTRGQRYRAQLRDVRRSTIEFTVRSRQASDPPRVAAIYPSANVLPANVLKFYIHFSQPMREGKRVFEHIKLYDDKRQLVEDPWRQTELWNADNTRLTLWVHPGRIKEGVALRDEIGPVLEPDRRYKLVIGENMLGANGQPIGSAVAKEFRTTTPVRDAIVIKDWKLSPPAEGKPLQVRFPKPLDRALLDRMLAVHDEKGREVAGSAAVSDAEQCWTFTPKFPFVAGEYVLKVDDNLEDVAGNTPARPFDLDQRLPIVKDTPRIIRFRVN